MMRTLKRFAAIFLIINMVAGLFNFNTRTYAANPGATDINISATTINSVSVGWVPVAGTTSVLVTSSNPNVSITQTGLDKAKIGNLQNNIMYDIKVEMYDGPNNTGNIIGEGLLYYIPSIIFQSSILDQQAESVEGGGKESGNSPKLNLMWYMPKFWYNGSYQYVTGVLDQMETELNNVYGDGRSIASLNFRVNISDSQQTLNGDSEIPSVNINYTAQGYKASVINATQTSDVNFNSATGQMTLTLAGRKDENSNIPAPQQYELPHSSILPGTVYYMNIKPIVKSSSGAMVNAMRVGNPSLQNGSPLYGAVSYTYTPIRFRLTRDELGNVYVRIYKINQGSLDLPRLYYEVQVSDDPTIPGDWQVKKTMDDSYFSQGQKYAVSAMTGISVNNELYYKIVVKSDSQTDRIESLDMPYVMSEDTSRPAVPKNLKIDGKELQTKEVTNPDNSTEILKTTNVTISWEKPTNWDEIKNNTADSERIYYQILLNTAQTDLNIDPAPALESEGKSYGNFQPVYRLVKFFDATSPNVKENGDRLEYTINGFDLFMGEDSDGISDETIPNVDNYPNWLLPNKVYYMQMYATKGTDDRGSTNAEDMSDKSITVSFTTITDTDRDVPLPRNLRISKNDAEVTTDPNTSETSITNHIELLFDKVNINWSNYTTAQASDCHQYYDIYMSTRVDTDSFIRIGTTEATGGDVVFTGVDDQSTSIRASISTFSAQELINRFGYKLRPNTVYYFMVKTRLSIDGQPEDMESLFTSMIPVTTVKGTTEQPDENSRRPIAPIDFAIANDENGNPAVTGSSVLLNWKRSENDVTYTIVCTSSLVSLDETASEFPNDAIYQSFIAAFGGQISIDPSLSPLQPGLQYDPTTRMCTYLVNKWLSPNRVYYFNIRAVNKVTGNTSQWISIPVTTSLISSPTALEAINDYQVAFSWTDTTTGLTGDDFVLFFQGPSDGIYKLLDRTKYTIIKNGSTYYARVVNLQPDTIYSVRVYKGKITQEPVNRNGLVYEKTDLSTRDGAHEIEIKWKGIEGYTYEIAIRTESQVQYFTLASSNMKSYTNDSNVVLPYRIERELNPDGTITSTFYAKIMSGPVTMLDGTVQNEPLKSNTKYYVKIRAVKIDPLDPTVVSYSKYVGPVDTRTEFNQDDYDDNEEDENIKAVFMDKISQLENGLYWEVTSANSAVSSILIKSDQLVEKINSSGNYPFVLDISAVKDGASADVVYISSAIIDALNYQGKSMTIRTSGAEYMIRPGSIDSLNDSIIKDLKNDAETKDIFYEFKITRENRAFKNLPSGTRIVSRANDLDLQGMASTITDNQLKEEIKKVLYEQDTGLVSKSINVLVNTYGDVFNGVGDESSVMDQVIAEVKTQLADYLANMINIENGPTNYMTRSSQIAEFKQPLVATLTYTSDSGLALPYKLDKLKNKWDKVESYVSYSQNSLSFNTSKPGEYAVLSIQSSFVDIVDDPYLKTDVENLTKRYDIKSILGTGTNLYPQSNVSVRETILLYEMIAGKSIENTGMDIRQKVKKLGLESIIGTGNVTRDITRQEASGILLNLYVLRTGADINSLTPKAVANIRDYSDITQKYIKYVQLAIDIGVMEIDANGNFKPYATVTREDIIHSLSRIIELTGE